MKIIKPGVVPSKTYRVYCGTCWNCKCEFEAEDSDLRSRRMEGYESDRFPNSGYDFKYVKCPTCKTEISDGYLKEKLKNKVG